MGLAGHGQQGEVWKVWSLAPGAGADVAAMLQHVLDTCDSGFTRRCQLEAQHMLPFLGTC